LQPPEYIPGDIELFYIARTVLSAVNITLLVVLIVTYASIYIKTRSEFTIGLLIFATVFLMKDLASNPFVIGAFGFRLYGLGPFALLPDLFEFVALTVLLYLSVKY
jgi:predicted membrane protein